MLTGQNGILNRAAETKEKTEESQKQENETLNEYEKTFNKYMSDTNKFERVDGTDLSTGLVIREKATGSEYVWIEVPKTGEVYKNAGLNISEFSEENCIKIESDLHTYTNEYRNGTGYSDNYLKDDKNGWFKNSKEYNDAKYKMIKSVYENGGFWVGRYEAGTTNYITKNENFSIIPVSKENMYPYIYVTRAQAEELAEKVESGNYTSSLMFGVQWDLMLKYIESKRSSVDSNIKDKLIDNSKTIGNFCDSSFTLDRGKYIQFTNFNLGKLWNEYNINTTGYVENKYKKSMSEGNGILMTTGASEMTKLQNIYDIAGNVWEWTLEQSADFTPFCARRGGSYYSYANPYTASYRSCDETSYSFMHIGFRVSLY